MDHPIVPGQTGYLTLNYEGAVLASGGDLDNDERTASILQTIITSACDRLDPKTFDQGFKRLTVTYEDHAYVACLSNRKVGHLFEIEEQVPLFSIIVVQRYIYSKTETRARRISRENTS